MRRLTAGTESLVTRRYADFCLSSLKLRADASYRVFLAQRMALRRVQPNELKSLQEEAGVQYRIDAWTSVASHLLRALHSIVTSWDGRCIVSIVLHVNPH